MKKFFSSIILSALVIGLFLKPVSVYAYTDLNTYVDPDLSVDDAKEYVAQTILAYALAAGAEMVVPGSGATVAEITDKVWDVIDFTDELYSWALKAKRNMQNGYLPWSDVTYNLDPGSASYNAPIMLAWDRLKENWDNEGGQIETYPEVNYLPYIELINGKSYNYQYMMTDNWITDVYNADLPTGQYGYTQLHSFDSVSYIAKSINSLNHWQSQSRILYYVASFNSQNNDYRIAAATYDYISVYINYIDNAYQITTSTLVKKPILNRSGYGDCYGFTGTYNKNTNTFDSIAPTLTSGGVPSSYTGSASTLEDAFKLVSMNFRNVNVYVDGVPWTIVTQPPDPIQLGGNTYITDTDTPVYYDFPDGTLFDPNAFAAIMRQLIDLNNTGNAITIQLDDVLESFTDEYGVTAQYVVNIVRNDYDNLLSEQYGNRQVRVQFPEELKQYSEEITYVMNNFGDDLIPQDLLTIICCGGILLLIGFLINRMLE